MCVFCVCEDDRMVVASSGDWTVLLIPPLISLLQAAMTAQNWSRIAGTLLRTQRWSTWWPRGLAFCSPLTTTCWWRTTSRTATLHSTTCLVYRQGEAMAVHTGKKLTCCSEDIIFGYTLQPGSCPKSYGPDVAKLAGIPPSVSNSCTRAHHITPQLRANNAHGSFLCDFW